MSIGRPQGGLIAPPPFSIFLDPSQPSFDYQKASFYSLHAFKLSLCFALQKV